MSQTALSEIFQRQAQFVKSLEPIYSRNAFFLHCEPMPWPIDDKHFQEEFRLLAWRCTEEVVEAVDVFYQTDSLTWGAEVAREKFNEEVSDALHFFVELCLALGITEGEILHGREGVEPVYESPLFDFFGVVSQNATWLSGGETIPQGWAYFIHKLGRAMYILRQRPWRTDNRITDRATLVHRMHEAFRVFVRACIISGISDSDLYNAYFAKGKINDQRTAEQQI